MAQIGFLDGKFYIIDLRVNHVSNKEFVGWFYDLTESVPSCVQVYNYIENNSLQDPFFEQVIRPLFNEQAKQRGIISLIGDSRKKPDKFQRIEGNLSALNDSSRLLFNVDKQNNEHFLRAKEQFLLVSPSCRSQIDCPDCIEGGVFIIKEKLRTLASDSVLIGRRHINNKRI